ncbi:MAG: diguanylate cyclase [Candidatus Izemoplasmatales bacterium]|nr:diguanylate cyclase [Candidatus Izemoplasmatales bacterium]
MNDIFIYASIGMMVLLWAASAIIYKKVRIWKILVFVLVGGLYPFMLYGHIWVSFVSLETALTYYPYLLWLSVIVLAITFKNKIKITQNLTDYDFFELEKELDEIRSSSELLRLRYISTISLLSHGLVFYDDDLSGMFVTDQFLDITKTESNQIAMEDYVKMIKEEDQASYLQTIKKASKKNPTYEMKYRIQRGSGHVWVEEKGKVFEFDKKAHLISMIKGMDIKLFPDTTIHEIDSLPTEVQLVPYLSQIMKEKEPFWLVMIHLTNIPDLNARFGREVGNLMIAEYLRKMRYHFAKDINSIFRVSGIQFALIIREQRKYEVLQRALQSGGDLVNLSLAIGGIQQVVYPNLGIIRNDPWSTHAVNELVSLANKALSEAITSVKRNYNIFGE